MSGYEVRDTHRADRDLRRLPPELARQVIRNIHAISEEPYHHIKKIKGSHPLHPVYSVRIRRGCGHSCRSITIFWSSMSLRWNTVRPHTGISNPGYVFESTCYLFSRDPIPWNTASTLTCGTLSTELCDAPAAPKICP